MDKVNLIGKDVTTLYTPYLPLKSGVFVDDITGAGSCDTGNNLIYNCSIMEEKKKMTFNNKEGKTEYMVIGRRGNKARTVTKEVKKGVIKKVHIR